MNAGRIEQVGPPREIYECPSSRFVATFIGNANCLPGVLLEAGVVRCGELVLRVPTPPSVGVGSEVTICVRPGAVRLTSPGSALPENTVRGRVDRAAFLGEQQDVRVDLPGDTHIRALAPSHESYPEGAEVAVHFPTSACLVVTS
jgi:ABC-type Fe3+/spermidine/putrescine transport system ATPase subunit